MSRRRGARSGTMDPGFTSQLDAAWNIALTFLILAAILSAIAQKATIMAEAAMEGAADEIKPIQVVLSEDGLGQGPQLALKDPGDYPAPAAHANVGEWMANLCENTKNSDEGATPVVLSFANEDLSHKAARQLALKVQRQIGSGCRTIY